MNWLKGVIIKGRGKGREMGIPTLNIEPKSGRPPEKGIYAVSCILRGEKYLGVASVGDNPTFPDKGFSIEIHLFDFDEKVYQEEIEIQFFKKLREEMAFGTKEDLTQQIKMDIVQAKSYFKERHKI